MNHDVFTQRARGALQAKSEGRADDAVAELRACLRDLEPAIRAGVNDWHQQQTLGLLVDALDVAGQQDECRAAWGELIRFTRDTATYWEEASASAQEDFARWSREHPPETDPPGVR